MLFKENISTYSDSGQPDPQGWSRSLEDFLSFLPKIIFDRTVSGSRLLTSSFLCLMHIIQIKHEVKLMRKI